MAVTQSNTQDVALQLEHVRNIVALAFAQDDTLLSAIEGKIEKNEVSTRTMRIPIRIQGNIPFTQYNPDGGDMGLGSNDIYQVFVNLTPVWFNTAVSLSELSTAATDSKKKAVEDVLVMAFKSARATLRSNLETLLNTDGSGTIATVTGAVSTLAGGQIQIPVTNPNAFSEGSTYQVFNSGTQRGTASCVSISAIQGVVAVTTSLANIAVNDTIAISGVTGAAGTSLFGLEYFDADSTTGSVLGLNRSDYPYKLNASHVDAGGAALSPALARSLKNDIIKTLGKENSDTDKLVAHMGLDQTQAWENAQLSVSVVNQQQLTGDSSLDMGKKYVPQTILGHKIIESIKAVPGRVDFLNLSHWGSAEIQPLDLYNVDGQTQFAQYGVSGGLSAAKMFYYRAGLQIWTDNMRANGFLDNLAIPTIN